MMDSEEKKRRQFVKVLLAEAMMVVSVIVIVVVATLLAMGFSISTNGGIEQTGLMQIHSQPTGATVTLDGSTLFSRTNTSRTMSAGEHHLKLSRDGYDTWEKTVRMYSGVLIRMYYPRLFLQNRVAESVLDLSTTSAGSGDSSASGGAGSSVGGSAAGTGSLANGAAGKNLEFYVPSPSRNYIIYAEQDAADWHLLDLRGDEVKTTALDLSGILPGMVTEPANGAGAGSAAGTGSSAGAAGKNSKTSQNKISTPQYRFDGKIELLKWSSNDEKVLAKVSYEAKSEWVLINLRNVAASLNLTKTFGLNFDQVEMIDNSASQLYALANHRLYRVNVAGEVLSRILVDNVESFVNRGANVLYLAMVDAKAETRTLGVYRDDEKGGTALLTVPANESVKIALSRYFDEDYIVYTVGKNLTAYYGTLPSYNENREKPALDDLKKLVDGRELEEVPTGFTASRDGEYVVARVGQKFMVTDLDMGDLWTYEAATSELNWLDASMMYAVKDGEILVWDFDGTNLRNLAESAKTAKDEPVKVANFPVMLTANNRWLYYLVEGENTYTLTRERVQ